MKSVEIRNIVGLESAAFQILGLAVYIVLYYFSFKCHLDEERFWIAPEIQTLKNNGIKQTQFLRRKKQQKIIYT